MKAPLIWKGIVLMRYTHACANFCKFCSVGVKQYDNIPFDSYVKVMKHFFDWNESVHVVSSISSGLMYTHFLMTEEQSRTYRSLCRRGGYHTLPLQLNGSVFLPDDDLRRILEGHRRAGYTSYTFTLAGQQVLHDQWAGRRGEFDYFLRLAAVAAELGYTRQEQLLLTTASLPQMEGLLRQLNDLPGERIRYAYPVMYIGNAAHLAQYRITQDDLKMLPAELAKIMGLECRSDGTPVSRVFLPEAKWLRQFRMHYPVDLPRQKYLSIRIQEKNLLSLASGNCSAIFQELVSRYQAVYHEIPEIPELMDRYGNRENQKLYCQVELERKWVETYLREEKRECLADYRLSPF